MAWHYGFVPLGFFLGSAFGGDRRRQNEQAFDIEISLNKRVACSEIDEEEYDRLRELAEGLKRQHCEDE